MKLAPFGEGDLIMKTKDRKRGLLKVLLTGILFSLLSSTASAAWYTVKVFQVVPRSDSGDVFVQLLPGAAETRFTEKSRGILLGASAGTNKIMAIMLTSIALNTEITVEMANVPAWNPAQVITAAGIVAPQ
jgi:hypothetical protein